MAEFDYSIVADFKKDAVHAGRKGMKRGYHLYGDRDYTPIGEKAKGQNPRKKAYGLAKYTDNSGNNFGSWWDPFGTADKMQKLAGYKMPDTLRLDLASHHGNFITKASMYSGGKEFKMTRLYNPKEMADSLKRQQKYEPKDRIVPIAETTDGYVGFDNNQSMVAYGMDENGKATEYNWNLPYEVWRQNLLTSLQLQYEKGARPHVKSKAK